MDRFRFQIIWLGDPVEAERVGSAPRLKCFIARQGGDTLQHHRPASGSTHVTLLLSFGDTELVRLLAPITKIAQTS